MKKALIVTLFITLVLYVGLPVIYGATPQPTRVNAKNVISRTAAVISTAQRFASQGQKYEGLGLAVAHQVYARELFRHGLYFDAIFHSLRARVLAAQVITQNKSDLLNEALYDRMEEQFIRDTPSDQELYQKLKEAKVEIMSDQAAANAKNDLDIN
jgi:hypothetical protein